MSTRELKIAHTESLFRDVNERIAESAKRFDSEEANFVCECSDPGRHAFPPRPGSRGS